MGAMPGNPHECREHAKNCLRLAEEATLSETKAKFRVLAQRWLDIAADLEATVELFKDAGIKPLEPIE
jgi:hypothetical protein